MSFYSELADFKKELRTTHRQPLTLAELRRIIRKDFLDINDFAQLISPGAYPYLEEIAQESHRRTVAHFGKTILLYTPLYLSNHCINQCIYCGFRHSNEIPRKAMTDEEIMREAAFIARTGLKHLLILTGESPEVTPVSYLTHALKLLKSFFQSISIEVYPLDEEGYASCIKEGADGLTLYQEVYCEDTYAKLHLEGPKCDFRYRLAAPERAAKAGIRTITIGALLGLAEWRTEAILSALHAQYLQKQFPSCDISLSFPRIRPEPGGYISASPVSDRDYVQLLCATRLFLPNAGITVSTRESAAFRDNILPLGVTKMSAGSSTAAGGHTGGDNEGQFDISDTRTVNEMMDALAAKGYKSILKDWHFIGEVS